MRIGEICYERSGISADTALRPARYFGTFVKFWTDIQSHYDAEGIKVELKNRLEKEVEVRVQAA